ncbi:MAG: ATP-binding cassette domain-containing protein [Candidatus Heimdallarchaeota archaeon]
MLNYIDEQRIKSVVTTKDLIKNFEIPGRESVQVLTGLNLEIFQGEFVGIMGPSGSGKSTLVSILSTLENLSAGEVKIHGTLLNDLKTNDLLNIRRTHSAIILQNFSLIDYLTATENVKFPFILRGVNHKEADG